MRENLKIEFKTEAGWNSVSEAGRILGMVGRRLPVGFGCRSDNQSGWTKVSVRSKVETRNSRQPAERGLRSEARIEKMKRLRINLGFITLVFHF